MARLAQLYGVCIPTVFSALHILSALGFVRISPGVGTFVRRPGAPITAVNHGWIHATPMELALLRATLDRQLAVAAANLVASAPAERLPPALEDLGFLTRERQWSGHAWAEDFLRADFAYHESIARAVRGAEVTAALYGFLAQRLQAHLVPHAERQIADEELSALHGTLTAAIVNGQPAHAARLAGEIARREAASVVERSPLG